MKKEIYKKSDKVKGLSQAGFTIMETMIYIALFGVIMTGAVTGAYNLLEGGKNNINSSKIEEEGTFLNRKINWALTSATDAVVSNGGETITIERPDLGGQSPIVISRNGTNMTLARGALVPLELNSERYHISDVLFVYTAPINGRPASISTSFNIEGKSFNFRNYLRQ